ncbi:hypothetical protein HPB51_027290 [Rhipicephalus microplus]|uniref:Uncharacterized protein n=1 Tax=Rhipicephalus microplus TaxID=6941 RepID=A0A9J6D0N9_RHIMP|nr:hypothetical protein HPB51_027290 [Rhipicephalus microplus]
MDVVDAEELAWGADEATKQEDLQTRCALGGTAKVSAPRFFATGFFYSSVKREETVAVTQPTVSICVRRVARAIVNGGIRDKWVNFPKTVEKKAAVN